MMKLSALFIVAALGAAGIYLLQTPATTSAAVAAKVPAAKLSLPSKATRETAIFAGGCFWGVEAVFEHVKGVSSATSGYAGGTAATADYESVSAGRTNHAEAVKVVFDPRMVSYADLLRVYFSVVADPTTLNRQGPDTGRQYRTALFPTSPEQTKIARAYIAQLTAAKSFARPIVVKVESGSFYNAETKHQNFMAKNPNHSYIVINDKPKVQALKREFPAWYKS